MSYRSWVALPSAVLLLGGCVVGEIKDLMHPTVSGEILVQQPSGQTQHLAPDTCYAGGREYYLGFDLESSKEDWRIRAVIDPIDGPVLRIRHGKAASAPAEIFRRAQCSTLSFNVESTGWRVNEILDLAGRLDVLCTSTDGAHVEGRLEVAHCH